MSKWNLQVHLVGESQERCQTSHNAQDSPLQQDYLAPNSIVLRLRSPGLESQAKKSVFSQPELWSDQASL